MEKSIQRANELEAVQVMEEEKRSYWKNRIQNRVRRKKNLKKETSEKVE